MGKKHKNGDCLETLVKMALPFLKEADKQNVRTGPGDRPHLPDWFIGVLIIIAVLQKKKAKSAQYRYLSENRQQIAEWTGEERFPARATYFRRYWAAHRLHQKAIRLQGEQAIKDKIVDPRDVAIDKSLVESMGPPWHKRDQNAGKQPAGIDSEAAWGYSQYHGWVYGYSFEVVVTATPNSPVFPLLASVDLASTSETKSCPEKLLQLPTGVVHTLLDAGYDANSLAELVEYDAADNKTGRHYLCPENPRNHRPKTKPYREDAQRAKSRRRREERRKLFKSKKSKKIYARRSKTVEPFNSWLKTMFEMEDGVWHRGLANNQTQILAAIFAYQLLVRYNHKRGNKNGQVRWILDIL